MQHNMIKCDCKRYKTQEHYCNRKVKISIMYSLITRFVTLGTYYNKK